MSNNDVHSINIRDIFEPIIRLQGLLTDTLQRLKTELSLSAKSQDVRLVALDACNRILGRFGWLFGAVFIATKKENFCSWKKLIDAEPDRIFAQKNMNDYLRLSIVSAIHFQIDNLFGLLLNEMKDLPPRQGFRAYASRLRERTRSTNEELDALMAFTYMRNCFHNNGIHRDRELHFKNDDFEVSFIPGQAVDYSIKHVFAILNVAIRTVCSWLQKEPLIEMKREIIDAGATAAEAFEG